MTYPAINQLTGASFVVPALAGLRSTPHGSSFHAIYLSGGFGASLLLLKALLH